MDKKPEINREKAKGYHDAMADILCWMAGFDAAQTDEYPFSDIDKDKLKSLKRDLNEIAWGDYEEVKDA